MLKKLIGTLLVVITAPMLGSEPEKSICGVADTPACKQLALPKSLYLNKNLANALQKNNLTEARLYLDAGADANYKDCSLLPELNIEETKTLTEKIIKLLSDNFDHYSARKLMTWITKYKKTDFLQSLSDNKDVPNKFKVWLLYGSISSGNFEYFKLLTESGINLADKCFLGDAILHIEAASMRYPKDYDKYLELLLKKGAPVNDTDSSGETPLHIAVHRGLRPFAETLLKNGANPDQICSFVDVDESSPLFGALGGPYIECLKLLLEYKANPDVCIRNGYTPLHHSISRGFCEKFFECAKILLEHNANPNAQDEYGQTPLHIANTQCTQLLLEYNANPNIQDKEGRTPLHFAGLAETKLLLEHKADPAIQDKYGETPLHFAAYYNENECLKILLKNSANSNMQNKKGETALDVAIRENHAECIQILREHSTCSAIQ